MSAPELLDPQQAAFWAADPNVLHSPDPLAPEPETEPEQTHHARLALEIAAAFLVCVRIARAHLKNQRDADPREAGEQAWTGVTGTFKALTSDALVRALRVDPHVSTLSPRQLTTLADTYVSGLARYLGESSVKAFVGSVDRQLSDRWSQQVAYARAVAGFGLEQQAFGPYLAKAAAAVDQEIVTPAAQAISDAALLVRAQLIGDTEARTAAEGVKAMLWRQQLANGELPPTARRRWATHHLDMDCAVCGALHGQEVELDRPFVVEKFEIWAPLAHPNCRCSIELVNPDIAKAYNPNERRGQPGNRGQWAANPTTYADPVEERTETPAPAVEKPASPFAGLDEASPFAGLEAEGSPFEQLSPFAALEAEDSPFERERRRGPSGRLRGPSGHLRAPSRVLSGGPSGVLSFKSQVDHTVTIVKIPPPPIPPRGEPYYMPVDAYHAEVDAGRLMHTAVPRWGEIDFDKAHPTRYGALHAVAHESVWHALPYDERAAGRVRVDDETGMPAASPDTVAQWWDEIAPNLYLGHGLALAQALPKWGAEGLVERLDDSDRSAIAEMAGFEMYRNQEELTEAIIDSVANDDSVGLAQAYADYVPLFAYEKLGPLGDTIHDQLQRGQLEGIDLTGRAYDQVLTFGSGFHPGTRQTDETADPRGRFVVVGMTYRSPFNDDDTGKVHPPPLQLGVQEALVQPMAKSRVSPMERWKAQRAIGQ